MNELSLKKTDPIHKHAKKYWLSAFYPLERWASHKEGIGTFLGYTQYPEACGRASVYFFRKFSTLPIAPLFASTTSTRIEHGVAELAVTPFLFTNKNKLQDNETRYGTNGPKADIEERVMKKDLQKVIGDLVKTTPQIMELMLFTAQTAAILFRTHT